MKVFGASQNQVSLYRHGLRVLEDACLDYKKAFKGVEIYLGAVFRDKAAECLQVQGGFMMDPQTLKIYDTEIDNYRSLYGDKAVAARIKLNFLRLLGRLVEIMYLPFNSPLWSELEKLTGLPLNVNRYYCKSRRTVIVPAAEALPALFEFAVKGFGSVELYLPTTDQPQYIAELEEVLCFAEGGTFETVKTSYHQMRSWFYSLWEQTYEWGIFRNNNPRAEANGLVYKYDLPPRMEGGHQLVQAGPLLEAHGFKIHSDKEGVTEYWR